MDTFPDKHLKKNPNLENSDTDIAGFRSEKSRSKESLKTEYVINQAIIWIAIVFIAIFIIEKLL